MVSEVTLGQHSLAHYSQEARNCGVARGSPLLYRHTYQLELSAGVACCLRGRQDVRILAVRRASVHIRERHTFDVEVMDHKRGALSGDMQDIRVLFTLVSR